MFQRWLLFRITKFDQNLHLLSSFNFEYKTFFKHLIWMKNSFLNVTKFERNQQEKHKPKISFVNWTQKAFILLGQI